MEPHIGEIRIFAGNFPPAGWAFCDGQILPISEYDTLYNLIGTTYGGDGQSTFALPNLLGRVPMHMGTGSSGTTYQLGESSGTESVTLTTQQIPAHNHTLQGKVSIPARGDSTGNSASPVGNALGISGGKKFFARTQSAAGEMAPMTMTTQINPGGGSQPHENMQPFLVLNFIISLYGIYPSQT
jgi:microcystin-dependent protein